MSQGMSLESHPPINDGVYVVPAITYAILQAIKSNIPPAQIVVPRYFLAITVAIDRLKPDLIYANAVVIN